MSEIAAWTMKSIGLGIAIALTAAQVEAGGAPDPALSYRVVDVAAGDELNVRQQPGLGGKVLGSLAPDDESVVITGSVMDVGGSQWWEIVLDGDRGWVNGRYLKPVDAEGGDSEYPLLCTGTEPFWSLEVAEGEATYSAVDDQALTMRAGPWQMAGGMTGRLAVELEHHGEIGHAAIWRENESCSDGMSDIRYPFGTIVIRPDGEIFAGCCRRLR